MKKLPGMRAAHKHKYRGKPDKPLEEDLTPLQALPHVAGARGFVAATKATHAAAKAGVGFLKHALTKGALNPAGGKAIGKMAGVTALERTKDKKSAKKKRYTKSPPTKPARAR